jgi:glycosyltransferase involved in cell wall biosynthesis
VVTIPNGVEIPEKVERSPRGGALRILFLGRLDPRKGIENLLAACRILRERGGLPWSLAVVGEGEPRYERSLLALVEELRIEADVRFAGAAYGPARQDVFAASDVVVVPSHTENFGMVVAEALASGVPVIASTATPWAGLESEACGLHVSNSPESLAAAIERVATLPLREMGERGRRWMSRDFGWDAIAARMSDLYREIRP